MTRPINIVFRVSRAEQAILIDLARRCRCSQSVLLRRLIALAHRLSREAS